MNVLQPQELDGIERHAKDRILWGFSECAVTVGQGITDEEIATLQNRFGAAPVRVVRHPIWPDILVFQRTDRSDVQDLSSLATRVAALPKNGWQFYLTGIFDIK
jgi:hypothetical protein